MLLARRGSPLTPDFTPAEELALDLNQGWPLLKGIQVGTATDSVPPTKTAPFIQCILFQYYTLTTINHLYCVMQSHISCCANWWLFYRLNKTVKQLYTWHLKRQIELADVRRIQKLKMKKLHDVLGPWNKKEDTKETGPGNPQTRERDKWFPCTLQAWLEPNILISYCSPSQAWSRHMTQAKK